MIKAAGCNAAFRTITANAAAIGMLVNPGKTQLLCVSSTIHSNVRSYIEPVSGTKIMCQDEMILLGFKFDRRPTVAAHVRFIEQKYCARSWMIRHLKWAGVPEKDMVGIYVAMIRPIIEYACQVYGPLLAACQEDDIEKLQRRILKLIYGHRTSYRAALEQAGIETLRERRRNICENFARKTLENNRYQDWFPRQTRCAYSLRRNPPLEEELSLIHI